MATLGQLEFNAERAIRLWTGGNCLQLGALLDPLTGLLFGRFMYLLYHVQIPYAIDVTHVLTTKDRDTASK